MDNRWEMNPINLDISRSKQKINYTIPTSFNLGELIPIDVIEVLPGSTHSFDVDSLVRMSTPIAPLMSDIYLDLYAFFVPNRLLWEHWEEFCGSNKTGAWFDSEADYQVPSVGICTTDNDSITDNDMFPGLGHDHTHYGRTLASYLGINFADSNTATEDDNYGDGVGLLSKVSVLEGRGYFVIYNEWFRNENFIPPFPVDLSSSASILVGDFGTYYSSYYATPLKVSKFMDIFTGCLPAPQKGDSVLIPTSGFAPVTTNNVAPGVGYKNNPLTWKAAINDSPITDENTVDLSLASTGQTQVVNGQGGREIVPANLYADLSRGVEITVNQLRYAFAVQKALEKDSRGGSRYYEMLKAHFGVTSPDATLQRPEYLGGKRIPINIQQVVSTAGHANSSSTSLGVPGANSVTGDNAHLFTKSFTEFGFIYIMACARMKEVYSQGTKRQFFRKNRFDYYYPVFANIGEQPIYGRELYNRPRAVGELVGGANAIFGYQEAWAEYRYIPSRVSGLLNPAYDNSLSFWTASEVFDPSTMVTLGQSFMEADRTALTRCLVTGETGPDFVADFALQDVAVLPMPIYSIPGLIDHH